MVEGLEFLGKKRVNAVIVTFPEHKSRRKNRISDIMFMLHSKSFGSIYGHLAPDLALPYCWDYYTHTQTLLQYKFRIQEFRRNLAWPLGLKIKNARNTGSDRMGEETCFCAWF